MRASSSPFALRHSAAAAAVALAAQALAIPTATPLLQTLAASIAAVVSP
jgi:hypothetical protein